MLVNANLCGSPIIPREPQSKGVFNVGLFPAYIRSWNSWIFRSHLLYSEPHESYLLQSTLPGPGDFTSSRRGWFPGWVQPRFVMCIFFVALIKAYTLGACGISTLFPFSSYFPPWRRPRRRIGIWQHVLLLVAVLLGLSLMLLLVVGDSSLSLLGDSSSHPWLRRR